MLKKLFLLVRSCPPGKSVFKSNHNYHVRCVQVTLVEAKQIKLENAE